MKTELSNSVFKTAIPLLFASWIKSLGTDRPLVIIKQAMSRLLRFRIASSLCFFDRVDR